MKRRRSSLRPHDGKCSFWTLLRRVTGALCLGLPVVTTPLVPKTVAAVELGSILRASTSASGGQTDMASGQPSVSMDGRWIAFASDASNLVANDTNGAPDIFVKDLQTGAIARVSVATGGAQGDQASSRPAISGDGSRVVFLSRATNLVGNDTNGASDDVFVHDVNTGVTSRVSVDSAGNQSHPPIGFIFSFAGPAISADGRFVTFDSAAGDLVAGDTNPGSDIFVHDLTTGETTLISLDRTGGPADSSSVAPAISADGRYVVFHSFASDLVADDTNARADVFVRDRVQGTTGRVSVDSHGIQNSGGFQTSIDLETPAISADGRYIAFHSPDGSLIANDDNGLTDVFVHDRSSGSIARVNLNSAGSPTTASGYFPADSTLSSMSADGRFVVFRSGAANLVRGGDLTWHVYVRDRLTGTTTRPSLASGGGNGSISADGSVIAFDTVAPLVMNDSNGVADVYVHDREFGVISSAPVLTLTAAQPILVTWQPPADMGVPITQYAIYRSTSPGHETLLTIVGNVTSYADQSVTANGPTYYYRVSALNGVSEGPLSTEQSAIASVPSTGDFTPLTPARLLDTREGNGAPRRPLAAGEQVDVQIAGRGGVPSAGAAAVVMNVTVTEPTKQSYLSVWPTGIPQPLVSNLNFVPGQTVPNLVTVALGANGMVSAFNLQGSVHVVFDVLGYYASDNGPLGSRFHGVTPTRLFDTRDWLRPPLQQGETLYVDVTGQGITPDAGVAAVVMNVTVTEPSAPSFLTVFPGDVSRPLASSLNFTVGLTVPNLVVVRVPESGAVGVYNNTGSVHVIADIVGYYDSVRTSEAGRFVGVTPARALDTRETDEALGPNEYGILEVAGRFGVPADASAVVLNVTATEPTQPGFLTVFPDDECFIPLASNLNFAAGVTVPNLVVVRLSSLSGCAELAGAVDVYNFSGTSHVIIDVFGYFT